MDLSTLTGESVPTLRSADLVDRGVPRLEARDLVFSGTTCTGGEAHGVVFATGMHAELGRIAALSERVKEEPSPLDRQVRRVAWLIAGIAVAMAVAFVPLAFFGAGLSLHDSIVFAVGLLAGNVPEGLLPVITLALAVAVSALARRGALVKRLSAVETLGSTDVICTDKTGTLTENRMRPVAIWTLRTTVELGDDGKPSGASERRDATEQSLATAAAACNNARLEPDGSVSGDPTEVAVLLAARALGADVGADARDRSRRAQYHFDPQRKLMSTLDAADTADVLHTKGAPESVLPCCAGALSGEGREVKLGAQEREQIAGAVARLAGGGMRVLAVAQKTLPSGAPLPTRDQAERELCFLGLIAMRDPPRREVHDAVTACHTAGIRIIVITGDHPLTGAAIARQVGIGGDAPTAVDASAIDHSTEAELRELLAGGKELVFARASPDAKLQIAEALRAQGHTIAMTGDGVNDAPALRRADIGVAMGARGPTSRARPRRWCSPTTTSPRSWWRSKPADRSTTTSASSSSTSLRTPRPRSLRSSSSRSAGGAVPLPLTVLQLLAFDVGTETLPSLALAREPAEPGAMQRPPRPRTEGVIGKQMLIRAWLFLGVLLRRRPWGGFFYVLTQAGWHPNDPVGTGHHLHHAYLQATTMTFRGMIAGQIGTAFAVRTRRASLRSIGFFSNRYLIYAIVAELLVAAVCVYVPALQSLLGTAALPLKYLALLIPYPFIVWGADELRRWYLRRRDPPRPALAGTPRPATP